MSKVLKDKKFLSVIMAIFSYVTICKTDSVVAYNVYTWLLLPILILLFYKYSFKKDEKVYKGIIIFALIFSFLLVLGRIIYIFKYSPTESFLKELLTIRSLVYLIGNFNLIYTLLNSFIPKLCKIESNKLINNKQSNKCFKVFIICALIMLICWSIYFIAYFPGGISNDSITQLGIIVNNYANMSDHHPVIHTLFISGPFKLGMKIFNNINYAVALVTITQMIIMAIIFSYFITFLYQRKIKTWILFIILMYFAVIPMHGYYSITMWKDIIYGGSILLLTIEAIKMLEKDKITLKNSIPFILFSLLSIFFRNNGIYAYILLLIFTFIIFKNNYKSLILISIIVLGTYYIVKGPIFNYFDIKKTSSTEYIAIPLQQIGRMAYKDIKFTEKEEKVINKLMPIDEMKKAYLPELADGIKFNKNYNVKVFDENKGEYLKLWLKLVCKHPVVASEAYLTSTLGYWFPGNENWSVNKAVDKNDLGIYNALKAPQLKETLEKIEQRDFPIINMTWSIGLCFWIISIFAFITKKRLGFKYLYPYILVFGVWITMMLASPVNGEFRYVYGAFTTLPLLMIYPFLSRKN